MTTNVRLLVHGATGRMGQALLRLCRDEGLGCEVVAAVARRVEGRALDGIPHFTTAELAGVPPFDVAVDFSLPEGFDAVLAFCRARGVPLVSGTTGLTDAQQGALNAASERIPFVWASNFSLGVAVLHDLVARAAALLPGWDCDIIEAHHTRKLDAPSGTALTLGEAARGGGTEPHYASIRAGDIVGEHTVLFAGEGERVEVSHRASSRATFARGAVRAAHWVAGRGPGLYDMQDVLGLRG